MQRGDATVIRTGDLALPATGAGDLSVPGSGVSIGLPPETAVDPAQVTDSDMVVYPGADDGEPSVVVTNSEDSTAVQVVIPDASASKRYTYDIAGATPVALDDGSVELHTPEGIVVGEIAAPWAVDAAGNPVSTVYEVEGQSLVQLVDFTEETQFPVVADPDIIFIAKCAAGVAIFVAENAAIAGKFWRVFKSAKAFAVIMKSIKGMSTAGKIAYVKSKLGAIAADASGIGDLVTRCTP